MTCSAPFVTINYHTTGKALQLTKVRICTPSFELRFVLPVLFISLAYERTRLPQMIIAAHRFVSSTAV
jgi:hypothetical protein